MSVPTPMRTSGGSEPPSRGSGSGTGGLITRSLLAVAGLAVAVGAQVLIAAPASAELCVGKTLCAKANNQVLHGSCGADTFFVGPYIGVTIHAGAGNDDVRAGFKPWDQHAYLGDGNDEISASGVVTVVASASWQRHPHRRQPG